MPGANPGDAWPREDTSAVTNLSVPSASRAPHAAADTGRPPASPPQQTPEASRGMNAAARAALFYASPTPAAAGAPRLLLFIYNFPPDPAVGGLRWQEMGRYFAGEGWAVDVVTRDFSELS